MIAKIFFTALLVLFAGCSNKADEENKAVLARINGDTITLEEFEGEFAAAGRDYSPSYVVDRETVLGLKAAYLNQLIEKRLILREAGKLGIKVGAEEVDAAISGVMKDYSDKKSFEKMFIKEDISFDRWRGKVEKKLFMDKVISQAVLSKIKVSAEEIEEYYNKNIADFHREEQVSARQMLFRGEKSALEARERVLAGESFASVAKEASFSPDAEVGGDLGYFSKGVMPPEFDEVVFTAKVGILSDVIKSDYGYHLFLVEDRKGAKELSLGEASSEITEILRREKEESLYEEWINELKNNVTIEINQELLAGRNRVQ